MTSKALKKEKGALRAWVRSHRDQMDPEERERRGARIADRVLALDQIRRAGTVMAFSSFGSEVPTEGIVERLAAEGHRIGLPVLEDGEIVSVAFRPGDAVVRTNFGAVEPAGRAEIPPADVDAVLTPGLAFDRHGHRLGYGGGFYDRFFRRLRPGVPRVAVCFEAQLVDEVPHGPGDERVHLIVTETQTIVVPPD